LHQVARGASAVLAVETLARDRVLAFHIPPGEAARVARVLGLAPCRRPPVYELVHDMAAALGGRIAGAVLDASADGICARLRITIEASAEAVEIACHPADAIAIALQSRVPILATAEALDRATRSEESKDTSEVGAWLERVRPADFEADLGGTRDA
jgi:bifunctional DNase/RNase